MAKEKIAVIAIDSNGDAADTHVQNAHLIYWINLDSKQTATITGLDAALFEASPPPFPIEIGPKDAVTGTYHLAGPFRVSKTGALKPRYTYLSYLGSKPPSLLSNNDTIDVP
jgi:hypothetical protein